MSIVTLNEEDILRHVLRELGYLNSPTDKVYAKYSAMSKRDYNKLVYRILKEYNMYFRPDVRDRINVKVLENTYEATYDYYVCGVKNSVSLAYDKK